MRVLFRRVAALAEATALAGAAVVLQRAGEALAHVGGNGDLLLFHVAAGEEQRGLGLLPFAL